VPLAKLLSATRTAAPRYFLCCAAAVSGLSGRRPTRARRRMQLHPCFAASLRLAAVRPPLAAAFKGAGGRAPGVARQELAARMELLQGTQRRGIVVCTSLTMTVRGAALHMGMYGKPAFGRQAPPSRAT